VTGRVIANAIEKTDSREDVLGVVTRLATRVREALGDDTSGSAQRFAMETLSATSLEVVREYAAAMEALSQSKFEDARLRFSNAVARDPNFGLAYAGLAIASRNVDKPQDAENYIKEAMKHLDGMTERERFRTRGLFYYLTSDYQSCVKEYGVLIARYAGDAAARNNLALCQTHLRNMPQAVQEMRQVVKILPNRALYRENLALYEDYAGEFPVAEQQVRGMQDPGVFALVALAFAELGQERLAEAEDTYQSIAKVDQQGASYTASGLGDLRMVEGRFSEAADILAKGADADLAAGDTDRAAAKFAALGRAQVARGRSALALTAADKALANSNTVKIRFLAARVYIDAGAPAKGLAIASGLASEIQAEPRAYAAILEGMASLKARDTAKATARLTEANGLLDTWIGHLELGRAYSAAGALQQAEAEFDQCISRRGEALALFLDEEPTFEFFPVVYAYQGQVREAMKSAKAAESYGAYLDIRGQSTEDPLVLEARRRAAR
jgi:tetratricopeptide (TPR) repeat protein